MSAFTASGTENLMVWDRRTSPFMEVWYATVTHREERTGLWLRYTISAPRDAEASCALWAFHFDRAGRRSFAGRNDRSIDYLGHVPGRDDGALVRIGDAWMSESHLEGTVESGGRTLAWSLDLEPADRCYHHLPAAMRRLAARRFSMLCSPNLSVPFSGTVELDGDVVRYEREPGCQTHRWGRRHARAWAWAHCSSWDGGEDVVLEGLGAQAAPWLPPLTFLYLRRGGEDLVFNVTRGRSRIDPPVWTFTANTEGWRIHGAARLHPDHSVQVRYADPDGGERHCVNSEIADLALEIYSRRGDGWRHETTLASTGTAHFELGRREPFADPPVAF